MSLRQALIPSHILGRASLDFVGEGAGPIGALVAGLVATAIGYARLGRSGWYSGRLVIVGLLASAPITDTPK